MLWLDRHKPGLKVIPPEIQEKLDAGSDFGDRAMGMFGPYEEMTVLQINWQHIEVQEKGDHSPI